MFYHGMGFGHHMGLFGGGPGIIIMFFIVMFVFSMLRRARYGGGYRGYRGNPRYQRPYRPYGPNPYQGNQPNQQNQPNQGNQPPASDSNPETPRNQTQYYGYGDAATQNDPGLKTVRTGTNAESAAPGDTGAPTTRVDNVPGGSGEPTRPLQ